MKYLFVAFALVFGVFTPASHAGLLGGLSVPSPASYGTVLGDVATIEVQGCFVSSLGSRLRAELDGQVVATHWVRGPYSGQWFAEIPLAKPGVHELVVSGRCIIFRDSYRRVFYNRRSHVSDLAVGLAHHFINQHSAKSLRWDWNDAVFLYGLQKLSSFDKSFAPYIHDYHAYWAAKGAPRIDKSDLCPSALTGLTLARDFSDPIGIVNAARVADYIQNEPRTRVGALNHLGHNILSNFYPKSVWVDSLMMYAVFATQWGVYDHNEALTNFGINQPLIFASVLQDPHSGFFWHAYKTESGNTIPSSNVFWLRGNAWALAATAEILEAMPQDAPQREPLLTVYRRLAVAFLRTQMRNGMWETVVNAPGKTYTETSGTALVAYGLAKGVHQGWLPADDIYAARRAFAAVTARLRWVGDGYSMPKISYHTNPSSLHGYKMVPLVSDAPYGVGAYLMAASELKGEVF